MVSVEKRSAGTAAPAGDSDEDRARRDVEVARRVLDIEGAGLTALADSLDESFMAAVDLLHGLQGRTVVTGMGKSGHVGRKIAATLASTGTPALYVHPGEASHGDLGMVTGGDAVIALSNSGNTAELNDIIAYTRRFSIPLIGMTARAKSALGEQSDALLLVPAAEEACPMSLAPTTSTTMMMALGDALAVALMERRGFSPGDFRMLHPGGSLGARLKKVGDIMHSGNELPLCRPDTPMDQAILTMTERKFGCVGVIDDAGRLQGIVTDGDLRRHMSDRLLRQTAGEVMTVAPLTIQAQALAAEALGQMNQGPRQITSLFVVDDEQKPVGILHIHDCLRAGVA